MNLILEILNDRSKYLLQYAANLTLDDKQHLKKDLKNALTYRWLEIFTMKSFDKESIKLHSHKFSVIYEQIYQFDDSEEQLMCEIYMLLMVLIDLRKTVVFIDLMETYTANTDEIVQLCKALVSIGLNYKDTHNSSFQHTKFDSVIEYSKNEKWSIDSKAFTLKLLTNIESDDFKHAVEAKWNSSHSENTFAITTGEKFYPELKDTNVNTKTAVSMKNKEVEVLTGVWYCGENYCVTNSTKIKNICELAHKQGIELKISPVSYISNGTFTVGMAFWTALFALSVFWLTMLCVKFGGDYWFIPVIYITAFALWDKGSKLFKFWYRWCVTGIIATMKSLIFVSKKPFVTATALIAGILTYMYLEKLNGTATQIVDTIMRMI